MPVLGLWPEAPSWAGRQDGDPAWCEPDSRGKNMGPTECTEHHSLGDRERGTKNRKEKRSKS